MDVGHCDFLNPPSLTQETLMYFLQSSDGVRACCQISYEIASLGALSLGDHTRAEMKLRLGPHGPAGLALSQPRAGGKLNEGAKRLVVGYFILFISFMGYSGSPPASGGAASPPPMNVNRTVPQVEPPKTRLEFSTSPTEDELFRARVFVEPLVPIGGKPTADENSDLAAALLGYAQRAGPMILPALLAF